MRAVYRFIAALLVDGPLPSVTEPFAFVTRGLYPAECTAEVDRRPFCQFPTDGPAQCTFPPGGYLLVVAVSSSVVFQLGDQFYDVTVTNDPCVAPARQLPGDCNQDAVVDISDAVCELGYLFLGTPAEPSCTDAEGNLGQGGATLLDWDGDQDLALTDAVDVLRFLFQWGKPHALGTECTHIEGCGASCGG